MRLLVSPDIVPGQTWTVLRYVLQIQRLFIKEEIYEKYSALSRVKITLFVPREVFLGHNGCHIQKYTGSAETDIKCTAQTSADVQIHAALPLILHPPFVLSLGNSPTEG